MTSIGEVSSARLPLFVRVALPVPLPRAFDYRWPDSSREPVIGGRVQVFFARRSMVGVIVSASGSSEVPAARLRPVTRIIDERAVLPEPMLGRLLWAAAYYHHPVGDVIAAALPAGLRKGAAAVPGQRERFALTTEPESVLEALGRAPVQRALVGRLAQAWHADTGRAGVRIGASTEAGSETGTEAGSEARTEAVGDAPVLRGELDAVELQSISSRWRVSLAPLIERGLVAARLSTRLPHNEASAAGPELVGEQEAARGAIVASLGSYRTFLLNGVTGSGKTEVYLQAIREVRARGLQTLVLVPEIALTPQLMARFAARLTGCLVALHSGLTESERQQGWLLAAGGDADIVIGTRSAVLTPLPRLGLVIVDEEHDGSLKQQEGFRYHARDLALMRARDAGVPLVLGSATPSFESLNNVATGRFVELPLSERAGGALAPTLALIDIRRRALVEGLAEPLIEAISAHLEAGGQAMVFINRRGFAPTLLCNDCGAAADCQRCDAHMTVHGASNRLRCHHCGSERDVPSRCESCASVRLDRVGHGTERIAAALSDAFPEVELARIDRDSTRLKGTLERELERATSGAARLLVGTQMLAKGHHFPELTLVGVLDVDRGLFGTDFRALEQMGQLVVQVAGRAGREQRPGQVLIQTRNPDNPMLQTLVADGYAAFARVALRERREARWPPYSYVALVRTDAPAPERALQALQTISDFIAHDLAASEREGKIELLGPAPAPMERLAGRFRARLLLQSSSRAALNQTLARLVSIIDELDGVRRVRWSIDVDPVDLF